MRKPNEKDHNKYQFSLKSGIFLSLFSSFISSLNSLIFLLSSAITFLASRSDFSRKVISTFFYLISIFFRSISTRCRLPLLRSLMRSSACAISLPSSCLTQTSQYLLNSFAPISLSSSLLFILRVTYSHSFYNLAISSRSLSPLVCKERTDSSSQDLRYSSLSLCSSSSQDSTDLLSSTFSKCLVFFSATSLWSSSSWASFLAFILDQIISICSAQLCNSPVGCCASSTSTCNFKSSTILLLSSTSLSVLPILALRLSSSSTKASTSFIVSFSLGSTSISSFASGIGILGCTSLGVSCTKLRFIGFL